MQELVLYLYTIPIMFKRILIHFVIVCITPCDIKRLPGGESFTGHVAL